MTAKVAIKAGLGLALVLYPAFVYFSIEKISISVLLAVIVAILAIRFWLSEDKFNHKAALLQLIAGVVCLVLSLYLEGTIGARVYPVIVNIIFLYLFTSSLFAKQSAIERLARIQEPNLSEQGVAYTRQVTKIWCLFFVINGSIATYTVFFTSMATWALYNGLISYLLMGALFIGEWFFRRLFVKEQIDA